MNLASCKVAYFQSVQFFFLILAPKCLTILYQAIFKAAEFYGNFQHPASDEYFCLLKRTLKLQADSHHPPTGSLSIHSRVLTAEWPQVFAYLVRSLWEHSHYDIAAPVLSALDRCVCVCVCFFMVSFPFDTKESLDNQRHSQIPGSLFHT